MNTTTLRTKAYAAALIGILALSVFGCKQRQAGQETSAPSAVKRPAVDLSGMQLRPGRDKASFLAVGRARNRTGRQVSSITLSFTMEDVLASGQSTTVAETTVVLNKVIPPGGSAEFSEPVLFKSMPAAKGRHEWNYAVTAVGNE